MRIRNVVASVAMALVVCVGLQAGDGKIEVTPQFGYLFGAKAYSYNYAGEFYLAPNIWYGGALDFAVRPDMEIELSGMYSKTSVTLNNYSPSIPNKNLFDVTSLYITVGALHEQRRGKLRPFVGGAVGVAVFTPDDRRYETLTRMALEFKGGLKADVTDKVGIRLQARLLAPISFAGLGFWCGTGGCSTGVSAGSTFAQFELSGGLYFVL